MLRISTLFVCLCLQLSLVAAGVREGMERKDVESALGAPLSVMRKGELELLFYPGGNKVELKEGKVVTMSPSLRAPDPVAPKVPQPVTLRDVLPKEGQTPVAPPAPKVDDFEATLPKENLDLQVSQVTRPLQTFGQSAAPAKEPGPPTVPYGLAMLIASVVQFLATMGALKIAFRWAGMPTDWGQLIVPALGDTLVRLAINLFATFVLQLPSLFYVDEGLAYFALLILLIRFTPACTLARAVAVAAAAKVASLLIWAFASVHILRLLFG